MTVRLGSKTLVVASSPEMAQQVLQKHDEAFSGRVISDTITKVQNYDLSLVWMPAGDKSRLIRRALSTFLLHPMKLDTLVGLRYKAMQEMVQHVTKFNIADAFPWLKPLDPQGLKRRAKVAYNWLNSVSNDFVTKRLQHRKLKIARHGDMLDSLLDYFQEELELNYEYVKFILVELLLGGTETSSITTEWVMTELILNPNIMATVREEIKKKVGDEGRIEESDVLELPYLQAVIKETMRLHLTLPLLIPHKTETEGQHFSFLPFGSGRRMCPGIPLAHRVVSLMVASLVYHFDWNLPHGLTPEKLDMNDTFGLALQKASHLWPYQQFAKNKF
ncbi:unnamed protein product [Thlaspi arvense]|uniref:Cytochrome P450 n=1 Tax=Thlaspi arvense TaxID=13288 RepID=A0AAU9RGZ3_THLAR|nr:unnamed protein product [Thlaspi arvense]